MEKKKYTDHKIKQTYRSDISIEANAKRAGVSVRRMNEWITEFGTSKNAKIKMRLEIIKASFDSDKNIKENYNNPVIQALGITYRTYIRDINKIMTKEEINLLINDVKQFNDNITVAPVDIEVKPISVDAIISNEVADETVSNTTNNRDYTDSEISIIGNGLIADGVQIPTPTGLKNLAQLPVYGDFSRITMIREAIKSGYLTNVEQYLYNSSINAPYCTETENLSKLSGEQTRCDTGAQNGHKLRPLHAQCSVGDTMSLNLGPMNMTFKDLSMPVQPTNQTEKGVTELTRKKQKAAASLF
ncbi:MAG: hypothetical protein HDS69_05850 [Bacteroidales bacterium]|nr:hypothetical protein [Bacteroidales bacterium]MBD5257378.1 hypothetical protein [Barnesiella sp.]